MKTAALVALNIVVPTSSIATTVTLLNNHKVELTVLDASAKASRFVNGVKIDICKEIEHKSDKDWCTEKQKIIKPSNN